MTSIRSSLPPWHSSPLLGRDAPEYLDREYNPRTSVHNLPDIFARWAHNAAETRLRSAPRVDLAYGPHPRQRLDYFPGAKQPGGQRPPLFVFIHGGYWRACDKSDFSWVASGPLQRGAAVALINYGRIPEQPLSALVAHARQAHCWLYRNAAELEFDADRIVTGGHSAGGHLTAMMLATRWNALDPSLPAALVRGGLTISGLFELEPLRHAPFIQDDLRLTDEETASLSPARLTPQPRASLITAVGANESDAFKKQSALIADCWEGAFVRHITVPSTHHYDVCDGLAQNGSELTQAIVELLELATR